MSDNPLEFDEVIDRLVKIYPSPVFLFINKQYNKICKTMLKKYETDIDIDNIEAFIPTWEEIKNANLLAFLNIKNKRELAKFCTNYGKPFNKDSEMTSMIAEDYFVDSLYKYVDLDIDRGFSWVIRGYIEDKSPLWRLFRNKTLGDDTIILGSIYARNLEALLYFKKTLGEFYGENLYFFSREFLATAIYEGWHEAVKELMQPCYCHVIGDCREKCIISDPKIQEITKDIFCGQCRELSIVHFVDPKIKLIRLNCQKCQNLMTSYVGGKHICYECSICQTCFNPYAKNIKHNGCVDCYEKCDRCDKHVYNDKFCDFDPHGNPNYKYCTDCKYVKCIKCNNIELRTTYLGSRFKCKSCKSYRSYRSYRKY